LTVNHLNRILAFVVDENVSLAIGGGAFRRCVFEFDGGDDVAGLGIDGGESADGAAVVREDDLVIRLVVHDAVESRPHFDLLNHGERLEVEHGDGLIAAVGGKAVTGFGGDARTVHAGCVRDVADHLAGGAIDDHHVGAARDEDASGGFFDGDVIRAALAFDVKFFNLERLRGKAGGEEDGKCDR
jgi:hypothetical protein